MRTIGEAITAKVKECIALYQNFKDDEKFKDRAKDLAMHDLVTAIYINEEALKLLLAYIDIDACEGET